MTFSFKNCKTTELNISWTYLNVILKLKITSILPDYIRTVSRSLADSVVPISTKSSVSNQTSVHSSSSEHARWSIAPYETSICTNQFLLGYLYQIVNCWIKYHLSFYFAGYFLSQLKSSHFICNHGAGFYKPNILQYPPSYFHDYSPRNSTILELST